MSPITCWTSARIVLDYVAFDRVIRQCTPEEVDLTPEIEIRRLTAVQLVERLRGFAEYKKGQPPARQALNELVRRRGLVFLLDAATQVDPVKFEAVQLEIWAAVATIC